MANMNNTLCLISKTKVFRQKTLMQTVSISIENKKTEDILLLLINYVKLIPLTYLYFSEMELPCSNNRIQSCAYMR